MRMLCFVFVMAIVSSAPAASQPVTSKYLRSALSECKGVTVTIISQDQSFDCEDVVRAISTNHLQVQRNRANTIYFSDDQGARYVAGLDIAMNLVIARIDEKQLRDFRRIAPDRKRLQNFIGRGRDHAKLVEVHKSNWFKTLPQGADGTYNYALNFIADQNLKSFAEIHRELAKLQVAADERTAQFEARNRAQAESNAIENERRVAAERAAVPNRYPSHNFGEVTTAIVDGNTKVFKEKNDLGWRAQYYHHFALEYAKKCISSPSLKRSWTIEYTNTTKDGFGNVVRRESFGTQTFTVESSQYEIAKKVYGDIFGVISYQAADMRSFVSSHSCNSSEMQSARRFLYAYGAERAKSIR